MGSKWKWFLGVVAASAIGWLALDALSMSALRRALDTPWPAGLGGYGEVARRYPKHPSTLAARHRAELAMAVGADLLPLAEHVKTNPPSPVQKELEALHLAMGDYNKQQMERPNDVIDPPPPAVEAFLSDHAADISALRENLLGPEREDVSWAVDLSRFNGPAPNLLGHLNASRLFAASALAKAQKGAVADAWEDLHALWEITRPLRNRPDMVSVLIAMSNTRMIEGVARKLPPPAPPWHDEVAKYDLRSSMLAAQQAEIMMGSRVVADAAAQEKGMARVAMTMGMPWIRYSASNMVRVSRDTAEQLAHETRCGFDGDALNRTVQASIPKWNVFGRVAMPAYGGIWRRVLLFTAEREATLRMLALKAGAPVQSHSDCAEGTWEVTAGDGWKELKFSRKLPPSSEQKTAIDLPLDLRCPR